MADDEQPAPRIRMIVGLGNVGANDARTRHTNADYPERMSEDELKESAIFMATFAWQAAVADEKIPRQAAR